MASCYSMGKWSVVQYGELFFHLWLKSSLEDGLCVCVGDLQYWTMVLSIFWKLRLKTQKVQLFLHQFFCG
jgi:hypothetical protein